MVIVSRFEPVTKDRLGRPKQTDCDCARVEIDGTRYFVLELSRTGFHEDRVIWRHGR